MGTVTTPFALASGAGPIDCQITPKSVLRRARSAPLRVLANTAREAETWSWPMQSPEVPKSVVPASGLRRTELDSMSQT